MCSILLATAYAAAVYAEAERPALDKYKAAFEQELVGINEQSARAATNWPVQYVGALKSVEQRLKEAGDLDGLLAVRQELERFGKDPTIPDEALVESPAELRSAQLRGRRELDSREVERCRRVVGLADRHVANLESLKRNLTREDKVDYAIAVKAEIDAVKARPDVTMAQFVVAAAGVDVKPASPSQPAIQPQQPPQTDRDRTGLPRELRNGLVLYYSFNRNEGGKVTDDSGNKNDGKVHAAKWSSKGKIGGALEFDGQNDYVDATRVLENPAKFTIGGWFKKREGNTYIFGWSGGRDSIPRCENTPDRLRFNTVFRPVRTPDSVKIDSAHVVVDGEWCHFAFTYDGTWLRAYVNGGNMVEAHQPGYYLPTEGSKLQIGAGHLPGGQFFAGSIDEFMVYDRALSEDEIGTIYGRQAKAR